MNTSIATIGEQLSMCRKAKGLTQEAVGAMSGLGKGMISRVENGLCLNVKTIGRIANALEMEPIGELKPLKQVDKNLIDYVMTAIIEFSKRYNLTITQASNYLVRFKGIDFLSEFYDVEHTLSFNDCVDDLTIVCQNNGGEIR